MFQSLQHFFSKPPIDSTVAGLYCLCVAQARLPIFYSDLGIPDTVEGRFDLLLLHSYLVMRRLGDEMKTKQELFDVMFADMERSLREMGVGDMSIAKKMKPMLAAFYGRAQAYERALNGRESLTAALGRNLYGTVLPRPELLICMTDYVRRTVAGLDTQQVNELVAGKVEFPIVSTTENER